MGERGSALRVAIATGRAGAGHRVSGEAIAGALASHARVLGGEVRVTTHDVLSEKAGRAYRFLTRPGWRRLHGAMFHLTNGPRAARLLELASGAVDEEALRALVGARPSVVVAMHPRLVGPLVAAARGIGAKVACFCPEMGRRNNHALYASPPRADRYLFGHAAAMGAFARRHGILAEALRETGFPLRQELYAPRRPRGEHREALGMDPARRLVLLTAGGEGNGRALPFVRAIAQRAPRVQVLALCGWNEPLRRALEGEAAALPPGLLRPLGYAPAATMRHALGAADVVVGLSAGVNQIVEAAVSGGAPFIAAGYVNGQETENLEVLEALGIGAVALGARPAAAAVERLLGSEVALERYRAPLDRFRAAHLSAPARVAAAIAEMAGEAVRQCA